MCGCGCMRVRGRGGWGGGRREDLVGIDARGLSLSKSQFAGSKYCSYKAFYSTDCGGWGGTSHLASVTETSQSFKTRRGKNNK